MSQSASVASSSSPASAVPASARVRSSTRSSTPASSSARSAPGRKAAATSAWTSSVSAALQALGREAGHDDDMAVLAVRLTDGARVIVLELPPAPRSASVARHAVRDLVGGDSDLAELLTTEVVANAVRHAGTGDVLLRAEVGGAGLRVEVTDGSATPPAGPNLPDWQDESGRGLLLLDALATSWGSEPRPGGKCVWFELTPG